MNLAIDLALIDHQGVNVERLRPELRLLWKRAVALWSEVPSAWKERAALGPEAVELERSLVEDRRRFVEAWQGFEEMKKKARAEGVKI